MKDEIKGHLCNGPFVSSIELCIHTLKYDLEDDILQKRLFYVIQILSLPRSSEFYHRAF